MSDSEKSIRVQKFLSEAGFCSRREAESLILKGFVQKNGQKVLIGETCTKKDRIFVRGKPVFLQKHRTFVFYKPKGVQTTLARLKNKRTLANFRFPVRVFPIGRLDKDSHGLLFLTTDGDLAQKLMHPSYHHEKVYEVTSKEPLSSDFCQRFEKGVKIDEKHLAKGKCVQIDPQKMRITLQEGRKRQIRRMFTALGAEVLDLKRVSHSGIGLNGLKPGQFYEISPEKAFLMSQ